MDIKQIHEKLLESGIKPETIIHYGERRIALRFAKDKKLMMAVKGLSGRKWSVSLNCWHIPWNQNLLVELLAKLGSKSQDNRLMKATMSKYPGGHSLNEMQMLALKAYVEMLKLKNYSENTIKNYSSWFCVFMRYFPDRKISTLAKNEILDFLVKYSKTQKWSSTIQNQLINAIKFFYEKLLNRPKELYVLPRAKKELKLPVVFSEGELKRLLLAPKNLKHKAMLCLAYATGLRVSEITNMRMKDIDADRMVITIRKGKGKKDRQVMLSEGLLSILRRYYFEEKNKPREWLFEGKGNVQYSIRSVQEVMKAAKKKAGIVKEGSIHAIRHSFATHLLESGTDLITIKELLGHSSIRTTLTYTHVSRKHISKVQSPFDKLGL